MRINYTYNATVVRVVDGDTVILKVDFGFRVFAESPFRLWGINCPEMNTPQGKLAKKRVEELLPVGKEIFAKTYKNPIDKYGRYLAELYVGSKNINQVLVKEGHAVTYMAIQ